MFVASALIASAGMLCAAQEANRGRSIDPSNSRLVIHVSKSGLLSAFADNHEVEAPIAQGFIDDVARQVEFSVESRRMKVLDPQLPADKRQQVQERMLSPDVLDVARFPQIRFESTDVQQAGPGRLLVRGQLSLHGVTRPVMVNVQAADGRYIGNVSLKQRDYGITPVTVGGGTVKVKDELKIEFDIRTAGQSSAAPR